MTSPEITVSPYVCICGDPTCAVPYGLCHCGCGKSVEIATRSKASRGHIKGRPIRYIAQHHARDPSLPMAVFANPFGVPYGYCYCNCGNKTEISRHGDAKNGYVIGEPKRFIRGHNICIPNEHLIFPTLDGAEIALLFIIGKRSGVMLVDASDLPLIQRTRWGLNDDGYAVGKVKGKRISAHRLLSGYAKGIEVDHKNRVRTDNRRENLRPATRQQSVSNTGILKRNKSGYKGVSRVGSKWLASIRHNGTRIRIGLYTKSIEAAYAYDAVAHSLRGDFAYLNFSSSIEAEEPPR